MIKNTRPHVPRESLNRDVGDEIRNKEDGKPLIGSGRRGERRVKLSFMEQAKTWRSEGNGKTRWEGEEKRKIGR